MPGETLDQLQENKLQWLDSLIASYEAAIATEGGEAEARAIADFILDEGIGIRQSSLRLWDYHWTNALAGKILNRQERGARLFALLDRGGHLIRRGAVFARVYADWSGHDLARLARFEEQGQAFFVWVKECKTRWDMLDQPRRPLRRERIAESQAAYARGEGEPISEVISRLKQCGPLVKE
jgi:hypothetical protein